MNLLIGALTIGLILALLGLGVFVTYRIYRTLDLTADGAFGVGAAVAAALLVRGFPALVATGVAIVAGMLAGGLTGVLNTRLGVTPLLAGVLTSTALYSVSLFVMGSGNVSLVSADGFVSVAERRRPDASEVQRLIADASRVRRDAGWKPAVPLENGLARTADWIRSRAEPYSSAEYVI